jgi:HSP20 family protein
LLGDRTHDPFSAMRRLSDEMHQWFNSSQFGRPAFSAQAPNGQAGAQSGAWMPQIETIQRGDQFIVRADLPGLPREDVSIEIEDGALTIAGERQQERETEHEGYVSSERSYGRFTRVVPLPEGVIVESADATFRNGVLEIVMPCAPRPENRGRRIEIRE